MQHFSLASIVLYLTFCVALCATLLVLQKGRTSRVQIGTPKEEETGSSEHTEMELPARDLEAEFAAEELGGNRFFDGLGGGSGGGGGTAAWSNKSW